MKQLKVFSIVCALLLSVACGGGGGGGDTVPDIYQGLYWLRMINGVDYSAYGYTMSVTSSAIVEVYTDVCQIQYDVTRVDGSKIYSKITATNCSNTRVGDEGWGEFYLSGSTLTVNTDSGSSVVLTKIG